MRPSERRIPASRPRSTWPPITAPARFHPGPLAGRRIPADAQAIERPFTMAASPRPAVRLESASPLGLHTTPPRPYLTSAWESHEIGLPCAAPMFANPVPRIQNIAFTPPGQHLDRPVTSSSFLPITAMLEGLRSLGMPSARLHPDRGQKELLQPCCLSDNTHPSSQLTTSQVPQLPSSAARVLRHMRLALLFAPPS